ncbi:MAG: ribokinase [Clostridiales bacterium]|nr:ribokinase [Clostridiales bacterium]
MRSKITVIGSLNYDVILKIPRLPQCGETLPVKSAVFSAGGKGANQAVQASKLGVETYMVGCVGEDVQGDYLVKTTEKYGVNTKYIRRCSESTGMGVVNALESGEVYACIVRGANFAITRADVDAAEEALKESETAIFQLEIPGEINEYAIDKAKKCGCRVLLNAAPAAEISEESLKKCDILVVNEVEAAFYLKEKIETSEQAEKGALYLSEKYGADIIITLGSLGSVVCEDGKTTFIPSKKVNAVESTGAGDSFIGAVGYALIEGMSLTEACKFATCCSAITVCKPGGQPAMPTLDEVKETYKD